MNGQYSTQNLLSYIRNVFEVCTRRSWYSRSRRYSSCYGLRLRDRTVPIFKHTSIHTWYSLFLNFIPYPIYFQAPGISGDLGPSFCTSFTNPPYSYYFKYSLIYEFINLFCKEKLLSFGLAFTVRLARQIISNLWHRWCSIRFTLSSLSWFWGCLTNPIQRTSRFCVPNFTPNVGATNLQILSSSPRF